MTSYFLLHSFRVTFQILSQNSSSAYSDDSKDSHYFISQLRKVCPLSLSYHSLPWWTLFFYKLFREYAVLWVELILLTGYSHYFSTLFLPFTSLMSSPFSNQYSFCLWTHRLCNFLDSKIKYYFSLRLFSFIFCEFARHFIPNLFESMLEYHQIVLLLVILNKPCCSCCW